MRSMKKASIIFASFSTLNCNMDIVVCTALFSPIICISIKDFVKQ